MLPKDNKCTLLQNTTVTATFTTTTTTTTSIATTCRAKNNEMRISSI